MNQVRPVVDILVLGDSVCFTSLCSSGVSAGAQPKPDATLAGFIIAADSEKCSPDVDTRTAPVSQCDVQETHNGGTERFTKRIYLRK